MLATDGVEQVELERPWQAREEAGAEPELVSLEGGTITAYQHVDEGDRKKVDATVGTADPDDYAALVLPGGVVNGDFLRADADAVAFVTAFSEAGRPVAAACHAPWVLAEADVVRGRRMTSTPSARHPSSCSPGPPRTAPTTTSELGRGPPQVAASNPAAGAMVSSVPANTRTAISRGPRDSWPVRRRHAPTPATRPVTASGARTTASCGSCSHTTVERK